MTSIPLRFAGYQQIAGDVSSRLSAHEGERPLAVIVPSAGMAEEIVRAAGSRASLQLYRLESLARRFLNDAGEFPRVATDGERPLAMRTAVRSVDDPMMTTRGVASMLERSYRDVRDSGMTLEAFRAKVQSARGVRNPARTRLVIRAWSEYERLIAQLGAIDPADLFERAAKRVAPEGAHFLVAGFYDMTGVQFGLLDAIRNAGRLDSVWVPTNARFAMPFVSRLAAEPAQPPREPMLHVRDVKQHVISHDTRIAELQQTANAIRALLDAGTNPRTIAVVFRSVDPYDARLFHRFSSELGFTTNWSEEIPLSAHRLGRGIVTLLRLRERNFPRAEVLELVRDGLRTKTRIDVDRADEETRRSRIAGGTTEELRVVKRRTRSVEDYMALVAELEALTASIELDKLPGLFRLDDDLDLLAAERIDEIAALFRRTAVWKRPLDIGAVVEAIESETLPVRGTPETSRIWFGDVMKFRGRAFEHVFALRMQDDVFPQRRNEDPLLPDHDRRLLAIREIGDGRDEEQLLFGLLGENANAAVRFSFAGTDGFGKVLRPSRLLREVRPADAGPPKASVGGPASAGRRPTQRALQLLARAGSRREFDGYLPPDLLRERVLKALQSVTPTQLEDFGECPQKFLFKHIFGVRDVDDPEREVQIHHREKGTLDHRILERFYRGLSAEEIFDAAAQLPRLPEALITRLESLIDRGFDEFAVEYPPFNHVVRDIERRATKRILRDFIAFDLAELKEHALAPMHFEYRFGPRYAERGDVAHPESFIVEAEGVRLRVDGSIDRIDSDGERFRIVDYKSGKALRHKELGKKIDRGVRLQLALYAMAVARFFELDPSRVSGAIRPLVVSADVKPATFAFELAEKEPALIETLSTFVRAILGGVFPAFPNERDDDFNSCKYCPVNHSCRTKHDVDERYAVQQSRDPRTLLLEGR
jgi:ATP-dependent helicase/DNAse subunit B